VKRRLETRLLVRDINGQVYGVTYKWRPDNSDADLLYSSLNEDILITNATGVTTQTWYYPSPSDCLTCHTPAANYVLGVNTRQLNRDLTYPSTGVTDNELRTLNHLGLFNAAFNETNIAGFAKMSALTNTSASLEDRVRSYLDANCSQCHQPGGIGPTFDARYDTPLASQNLINGALDANGYAMIKPRDIWRSEIRQRMDTTNNAIKMPPLARNLIDSNAVQVLTDYINSLPGIPALAPPTLTPDGGSFVASANVSAQQPDTNAVIYYTLDGSSPTTNSLRYHGPITLLDSATVSASSFRTGYVNSVTASAYFLVEPLHFTTQGFTNDVFQLRFAGSTGSNYVLQATTNFVDWTPIATNTAITNHFNFYDANATNYPYRFYRVKKQ
jgi:mono/diheme cytochrome c family protein